jgi:hypothetical protein
MAGVCVTSNDLYVLGVLVPKKTRSEAQIILSLYEDTEHMFLRTSDNSGRFRGDLCGDIFVADISSGTRLILSKDRETKKYKTYARTIDGVEKIITISDLNAFLYRRGIRFLFDCETEEWNLLIEPDDAAVTTAEDEMKDIKSYGFGVE